MRGRALLVAAAAVAVWLPAVGAGFVADDYALLNTLEAIGDPVDPFTRNDLGQTGDAGHFYRPLWVLWHSGIEAVFGAEAAAFHLLNLALFALIAVQVLVLARHLLDPTRALIAGLGFALYPRHGETVAWISGSTDLLATALGLGALLALLAPWRRGARLAAAVALTVLAGLAKEAAFVLPLLAAALLLLHPERDRPDLRELRRPAPVAMAGALVAVLIVRAAVIGGAGGYGEDPVSGPRVVAAAGSYAIAAVTPHELQLLRYPALLVVPVLLLGLLAWALLRARLEPERRRVVWLGHVWFALALAPVLGIPLDLNTATGERLLFLPSVGLAIGLAALLPDPRRTSVRVALAAACVVLALLSLSSARNWDRAGEIADRVTSQAAELVPAGRLTLLSIPESFRNAHIFTNSFDLALERRLGRPVSVSWCIPLIVRNERRGEVTFRRAAGGTFLGRTGWDAPFDFPVTGDPEPLTDGCDYGRVEGSPGRVGMELGGLARPAPAAAYAAFDGERLVRITDPRR